MIYKKIKLAFLVLCLFVGLSQSINAQVETDLTEMVGETQQMINKNNKLELVWWMPTDYWSVSTKGSGHVTNSMLKEIEDAVEDYFIVAVLSGESGIFGLSYEDEEVIRESLVLKADGKVYKPIPNKELPDETRNIIAMLQPTFSSMLGQMGENLNVYVFEGKNKKGQLLADPVKEGAFTIETARNSFNWKLPLSCMVEKKMCAEDKELMSGNWKFCPWHGTNLVEKPEGMGKEIDEELINKPPPPPRPVEGSKN